MKRVSRRKFLEKSTLGIAGASIISLTSCNPPQNNCLDSRFVHYVLFWLKEQSDTEIRSKFEKALKELVTIETIVDYHLGIPVPSERDIVDDSFAYSLLISFRNKEGHDIYQKHPTHLKFAKDCEDIWDRVVVHDSVNM